MRVAHLDMTNSSHQCPSSFRQRTNSGIRTCVTSDTSSGCFSSIVSSTVNIIGYSRVCGKIIGYQIVGPNAFSFRQDNSIDSVYVDGISLTRGNPREHIWTLAAARDETSDSQSRAHAQCPCISGGTSTPPSFVGNDYFCDTGSTVLGINFGDFFTDPLWDGAGCGSTSACCSFNSPPWFYQELPQATTDNIEMRVCRDESARCEDIGIEMIELYIM